MRLTTTLAFLLLTSSSAWAANWYVRPNGTSSGNGSSWTSAFNGFSGIQWSSIAAGDTIWVAGGTYSQNLVPGKSGTSSAPIAIRRARSDASACTSASGWNSSYASTISQPGTRITINSVNYIIISGATSANGGSHGWHIDFSSRTSGVGIEWPNGATGSNNLIEWIDIEGPGYVTYSSDGRGIDATPFSSAKNNTFAHCKIHDWESTVYLAGFNNCTFEYCEFWGVRAVNSAQFHPNMIYMQDADYLIFRYNHVHGYVGEGLFWTNNDSNVTQSLIYGNLFENTLGASHKIFQPDNTGTFTGLRIWNNTLDNCPSLVFYGDSRFSDCEARNNIISRSGNDPFPSSFSKSNNLVTSSDVFVSRANGDYRIVATTGSGFPRNAGTALASDGLVNVDRQGVQRGSDGSWDIGAFEYSTSGGGTVTPPDGAPSNLQATP